MAFLLLVLTGASAMSLPVGGNRSWSNYFNPHLAKIFDLPFLKIIADRFWDFSVVIGCCNWMLVLVLVPSLLTEWAR